MWFFILVLMDSFVYVLGLFGEINPRKQKLVWYTLDVDKVEFDLSQDPECHGFRYANVGVSFEFFFFFCFVLLKACVVRIRTLAFQCLPDLLLF
jgi:hypothetical protein